MRLSDTPHTSGSTLLEVQGKPVYYVDGLPCIIYSEKETTAHIGLIDEKTFAVSDAYLASFNGFVSHGATLKDAYAEAQYKYNASKTFDERKEEFVEKFKKGKKYPARDFFIWHGLITGSCEIGRNAFVMNKNIDLASDMTVKQFFDLVETEYGSNAIEEVKREYND